MIIAAYKGWKQWRKYQRMRAAVTVISKYWKRVLAKRLLAKRRKAAQDIRKYDVDISSYCARSLAHGTQPKASGVTRGKRRDIILSHSLILYFQQCYMVDDVIEQAKVNPPPYMFLAILLISVMLFEMTCKLSNKVSLFNKQISVQMLSEVST